MVPTPTLPVTGLADPSPIALDRLVGRALDDESTALQVPLIELLTAIRVRADADILVLDLADGASIALSIRSALARRDAHLLIDPGAGRAWLVDTSCDPVAPVVGVRAMSFESFVGARW